MRKGYIAINHTDWGKDAEAEKAVRSVIPRVRKSTKLQSKHVKGMRLIEVTYPDDETKADDITFYFGGGYECKGRATAVHFDEDAIIEFLKGL